MYMYFLQLPFGMFDYILIAISFVSPLVWSSIGLAAGWYGSAGAW